MYPQTSYIIYATPRSGSYLLCEALTNTGLAGQPREFFNPNQGLLFFEQCGVHWSHTAEYLHWTYATGTTPNGVFGIKIIWSFFEECIDQLRDIEGNEKLSVPDLLAKVFPRHQAIMITRQDKVRQAISYWKALQTDTWVSFEEEKKPTLPAKELVFNFQEIEYLRRRLIECEQEMQQYFAEYHIQPLVIVYEDFVKAYEKTALQVLDYLHIPIPADLLFGERKMQKQSDSQTEEWLKNYYAIKQTQENAAAHKTQ